MSTYLKACEVAEIIGLSTPTVHRLAKDNVIPKPVRMGKRSLLWFRNEIEDYLAACKSNRVA